MTDIQRWRLADRGEIFAIYGDTGDGGYVLYADHVAAVKQAERESWKGGYGVGHRHALEEAAQFGSVSLDDYEDVKKRAYEQGFRDGAEHARQAMNDALRAKSIDGGFFNPLSVVITDD